MHVPRLPAPNFEDCVAIVASGQLAAVAAGKTTRAQPAAMRQA